MRLYEIDASHSKLKKIQKFAAWAISKLKIKSPPEIEYSDDRARVDSDRTFGSTNSEGQIWVYLGNRNPADIMRTLCHELIHHRQFEVGTAHNSMDESRRLKIEDEANAIAGRMMRDYGAQNADIYESKGDLTASVSDSLPATYIIPELQNQNPYMQYRFMVAMAGAKGKKHRQQDGVPQFDPESVWGQNEIVIGQDPHLGEYIDDALSQIGLKGKKLISTSGSTEGPGTGVKSVVQAFKGYPR